MGAEGLARARVLAQVLRSSVREFLVSEAMHNLGVGTTRALSLVASASETADRPWRAPLPPHRPLHAQAAASTPASVDEAAGQ